MIKNPAIANIYPDRQRTQPTTSNSLRTVIAVSYAQPPPGHASFHGRTTTSAIEASMLQARACGTVYRRTCDET